jgi:hypothetical protein
MGTARPILYLDTCAIIEVYRVKCWPQLVNRYELHTVQKCREELESGNPYDPDYISFDLQQIDETMVIHELVPKQKVAAAVQSATLGALDEGEKDLLSWCADQAPKAMIITTGDRAAIVAACELGLRENLRSLEEIATAIGVRANFQKHYQRIWLTKICTKYALGYI